MTSTALSVRGVRVRLAALQALLEQVRPNVAAHPERAKSIQGSLGRQ